MVGCLDDLLDVGVRVPEGSRTTSLHGGYLKECVLYDYQYARDLSPRFAQSDKALQGHPLARARGLG